MADVGLVVLADPSVLADELRAAANRHAVVAVVRADDEVLDGAFEDLRNSVGAHPDADVIYGDELRVDDGRDVPFYKPAWSPDRLRCQHLTSGLTAYSSDLIEAVVGRLGPASSTMAALHDLALAASEEADQVVHVPLPWARIGGPETSRRLDPSVLDRHLDRCSLPMRAVESAHGSHLLGFEPALREHPMVSIVVPTGGARRQVRGRVIDLVDNAIASVLSRTDYPDFEVVVVADARSTAEMHDRLEALDPGRVRVVVDDRPFNFSAAVNLGVEAARGSFVLLLNDDTEVMQSDWMSRLVSLGVVDGVGAVGAKLLFGDGRIQHAGATIRHATPGHTYHGHRGDSTGHGDELLVPIDVRWATGACLLVRRDRWQAVGGMGEGFPLNYNDVDFCLRLAQEGWRIVVDNTVVLMHLETSTRSGGSERWEDDAFKSAWPGIFDPDPFDNPNFVDHEMGRVAVPAALVELRRARRGIPAARVTVTQ